MKNTLLIAYISGTYATYLEWVLTTMMTEIPIVAPFDTKRGHSHGFPGNNIGTFRDWQLYDSGDQEFLTGRMHPKTSQEDSIGANIKTMLGQSRGVVHLYPDRNLKIFTINNWFQKTWTDWWERQLHRVKDIDAEVIYKNWPVDRSTPITEVPIWIRREFLSLFLLPMWEDTVEWYFPDRWDDKDCCTVYISDLLYNFENTINRIVKYADWAPKKSVEEFTNLHDQMLGLQKNIGQDQLCIDIVNKTLSGELLDLTNQYLPLASEAWIQWELRNRGWEIQCHELDAFPTSTQKLSDLLQPIVS